MNSSFQDQLEYLIRCQFILYICDNNYKYNSTQKEVAYFASCMARHAETDITIAAVRLISAAGVDFAYAGEKEDCCGTPCLSLASGMSLPRR